MESDRSSKVKEAHDLLRESLGPNASAPLSEFTDPTSDLLVRQIAECCISWLASNNCEKHNRLLTNYALIAERR